VSGDESVVPGTSDTFETRTAPPAGPADFRFAFVCDTGIAGRRDGNASGTLRVIEALLAARPLFVLGGGDYAYARGDGRFREVGEAVDAWFDQMEPLIARIPFLPQYGNHEVSLGERFRDWAPRFAHPEGSEQARSYSFAVADVHFAALFVPEGLPGAEQIAWLEADLAAARARGVRWRVVYQHQPIFASGRSHPSDPRVARLLGPVFERHRVDLHLSGHDQSYERTHPLVGLAEEPLVASRAVDRYAKGKGVIYAKVSPSGKRSDIRNDFSRFHSERPSHVAVRDDTAHHYALVDVQVSGELAVRVFQIGEDAGPPKCIDAFRIVDPTAEGDR
jgi:3',5'-cyclic AMP phosphodiesterase CpdA